MKTSPHLVRLGARTKLFKRHLLEWKALLETQRIIRHSTQALVSRDHLTLKRDSPQTIPITAITQQVIRFNLLNRSQFSDRKQLTARQQQEDTELEKVLDDHKNGATPAKIPKTTKGGDM